MIQGKFLMFNNLYNIFTLPFFKIFCFISYIFRKRVNYFVHIDGKIKHILNDYYIYKDYNLINIKEEYFLAKYSFYKGKLHSFNDNPAYSSLGINKWYKNGVLHRNNDLPAYIEEQFVLKWYNNGKIHRDNLKPAVKYVHENIAEEFWVNGEQLNEDDFRKYSLKNNLNNF